MYSCSISFFLFRATNITEVSYYEVPDLILCREPSNFHFQGSSFSEAKADWSLDAFSVFPLIWRTLSAAVYNFDLTSWSCVIIFTTNKTLLYIERLIIYKTATCCTFLKGFVLAWRSDMDLSTLELIRC